MRNSFPDSSSSSRDRRLMTRCFVSACFVTNLLLLLRNCVAAHSLQECIFSSQTWLFATTATDGLRIDVELLNIANLQPQELLQQRKTPLLFCSSDLCCVLCLQGGCSFCCSGALVDVQTRQLRQGKSDPNLQSVVILSPDCGFVRKLGSWMSPSSSSSSSSIGAVI